MLKKIGELMLSILNPKWCPNGQNFEDWTAYNYLLNYRDFENLTKDEVCTTLQLVLTVFFARLSTSNLLSNLVPRVHLQHR